MKTNKDERRAAVERAEQGLKLVHKKVAEFYDDHDPKARSSAHGNRYCAELIAMRSPN